MTETNQKPKKTSEPSQRLAMLWQIVREQPGRVALNASLMTVATILEGVGIAAFLPMLGVAIGRGESTQDADPFSKAFADAIASAGFEPTLVVLLGLILLLFFGKLIFLLLAQFQISHAQARYTAEVRQRLLGSLFRSRWDQIHKKTTGQIANTLGPEVQKASRSFFLTCTILSSIPQILIYMTTAAMISWHATVGALFVGGVMFVLLRGLVSRTRTLSQRRVAVMNEYMHQVVDNFEGLKSIKAMGLVKYFEGRLKGQILELSDVTAWSAFIAQAMSQLQEFIGIIAAVVLIYIFLGEMNLGFEVTLVTSFLFLRAIQTVATLQKLWQKTTNVEVPYSFIKNIVDETEGANESHTGRDEPALAEGIRFENVSFQYGDKEVLSNVTINIPACAFTCFVGPSGSGKTTFIDLIIGLLSPRSGQILIDGKDLQDVDIQKWRNLIGYVPQETVLFGGSILENIRLGDETISEEAVMDALKKADAWDFVEKIPGGLHGSIGERGGRLSGGQRQRLAVARAIVRKPLLLVLDEPTSSLDEESERSLADTLSDIATDTTVVGITHRPYLVEIADLAVKVAQGNFCFIGKDQGRAG